MLSWSVKRLRKWRRENNFDGLEATDRALPVLLAPVPSDDIVTSVMDETLLMGYHFKDVAMRLGISEDQLFRWRKKQTMSIHDLFLILILWTTL